MPTAARLTAAVLLAALGWFVAGLIVPYLTEGRQVTYFAYTAAGVGALVGWFFAGRKFDRAAGTAGGIGFASASLLVFWTGTLTSLYEMVQRSTRLAYDGPVEALQGMVEIFIKDIRDAAQVDVIIALLIGGMAVGTITNWVARRYP